MTVADHEYARILQGLMMIVGNVVILVITASRLYNGQRGAAEVEIDEIQGVQL